MTTRRITANIPEDLLKVAQRATGKGITETIIEGLEQIRRRTFYDRLLAYKGKMHLDIDTNVSRGRGERRR